MLLLMLCFWAYFYWWYLDSFLCYLNFFYNNNIIDPISTSVLNFLVGQLIWIPKFLIHIHLGKVFFFFFLISVWSIDPTELYLAPPLCGCMAFASYKSLDMSLSVSLLVTRDKLSLWLILILLLYFSLCPLWG